MYIIKYNNKMRFCQLLKLNKNGYTNKKTTRSDYMAVKSVEEFKTYLLQEEKSENTVEKYMRDVRAWREWSVQSGEWSCTKESVISYKNYLIEKGYAERSINSMLCSVNAFLDFSGLNDCKVKLLKMQKEVFCDESRELTEKEYKRLCNTALKDGNRRLYMLLQTLCNTGIRVSELKFVTVEAVRNSKMTVRLKGKTRTVYFIKDLKNMLLSFAKETGILSGQIFITKTGKPLNRTNIWKEMKNLCRKAKVKESKVFPHNLRHLFAKMFYAVKKDIAKLADVLGHSSIETTRLYIITNGSEHRRIMEKMKMIL